MPGKFTGIGLAPFVPGPNPAEESFRLTDPTIEPLKRSISLPATGRATVIFGGFFTLQPSAWASKKKRLRITGAVSDLLDQQQDDGLSIFFPTLFTESSSRTRRRRSDTSTRDTDSRKHNLLDHDNRDDHPQGEPDVRHLFLLFG